MKNGATTKKTTMTAKATSWWRLVAEGVSRAGAASRAVVTGYFSRPKSPVGLTSRTSAMITKMTVFEASG